MSEFQAGDMRIGDAERESAMTALGEHMSAGRLTIDEYGERSAQITTVKTRAELLALFEDLPQPHPSFTGAPTSTPAPAPEPTPVAVRSGRPAAHRVFDALVPLSGLVGLGFLILPPHWWFMIFLPAVVMIIGQAVLGDDWRRQHKMRKFDEKSTRLQERMEERGQRMAERAQRMADRIERRHNRW